MRSKVISVTSVGWLACVLVGLACAELPAQAAEMKLQAFLLWGTDERKPPEGKAYNPVSADIRQKLKDLPLKWTNWFEVNRKDFVVPQGTTKEVPMSAKCQVNVSYLAGSEVEVSLIGKGKETLKRTQSLPRGEILFLGGNAPNSTSWLVGLKRIE